MPKVGVEPTRANAHYALNVARLPVPPLRRLNLQGGIILQAGLLVNLAAFMYANQKSKMDPTTILNPANCSDLTTSPGPYLPTKL